MRFLEGAISQTDKRSSSNSYTKMAFWNYPSLKFINACPPENMIIYNPHLHLRHRKNRFLLRQFIRERQKKISAKSRTRRKVKNAAQAKKHGKKKQDSQNFLNTADHFPSLPHITSSFPKTTLLIRADKGSFTSMANSPIQTKKHTLSTHPTSLASEGIFWVLNKNEC